MRVLVSKNGPNHQEGTEAAVQRSVLMALILSIALAAAYFGALYLIAH